MPGMWDLFPEVSPPERLLSYIFAYDPPQKGQNILDLGCGLGGLVFYCLKNYPTINSITGIDLLPEHIEQAKQYNSEQEKSNFFVNDATQLSNSNNQRLQDIINKKFHKIYLIDVTQDLTVQQFKSIFNNCFYYLHNQGTLVIHTQTINKTPCSWQEQLAANLLVSPYAPNLNDIKQAINQYWDKNQIEFEYVDITSVGFKKCLEEKIIKESNIIENLLFYPFPYIIKRLSLDLFNLIKKGGFSEYIIFIKKK